MNEPIGARPWSVRTRCSPAEMLRDLDAPGDREFVAVGRAEAEQLDMALESVRFERLNEPLS